MQDNIENLKAQITRQENVNRNLILRYDNGEFPTTKPPSNVDGHALAKKAEALAQRVMLENFDLRVGCVCRARGVRPDNAWFLPAQDGGHPGDGV